LSLVAKQHVNLLPYNINLRPYQRDLFKAIFIDHYKLAYLIWHRQAGKDRGCFQVILCSALMRKGNYFIIFPTHTQARRSLWDNIDKDGHKFIDQIPKDLIKRTNDTLMKIKLINGSEIQILGGLNLDALRGASPKGIIFSEYALHHPKALAVVKSMLSISGGWMMLNTTPIGEPNEHNHAYAMWNKAKSNPGEWYTSLLTCLDTYDNDGNRIYTDEMIKSDAQVMTLDMIKQELYCIWTIASDAVIFKQEMKKAEKNGKICDFEIDPKLPVHTSWDLSFSKSNADLMAIVFFQIVQNGNIKIVHYHDDFGHGISHYVNYINNWCTQHSCVLGKSLWPHDGVKTESSGSTRQETAQQLGLRINIVPKINRKGDAINSARMHFHQFMFHKHSASKLIDCLMNYKRKRDKHGVDIGPEHLWPSHGADAFMGICQAKDIGMLAGLDSAHMMQSFSNPSCQEPLI